MLKPWFKWFFLFTVLFVLWWFFPLENADTWRVGPPPLWAYRESEEEREASRTQYLYVPLSRMSTSVIAATILGEDLRFFEHGGVDIESMRVALEDTLLHHKPLRGASTITQQLAKNVFVNHNRSFLRKIIELRWAFWLERKLSKKRILELYLNIVELGPHLYGVEAASRVYFHTHAAMLTQEQAAALVATLPWPKTHNPNHRTYGWERRKRIILNRLIRDGYIRKLVARCCR